MTERPGRPEVVVVTGASSGIGLSAARAFAARGARLVLASRSAERLTVVAAQCLADGAAGASVVVTDVADEQSAHNLIDGAVAEHGRVDVQHRSLAQARQDLVHRLDGRCGTGPLAGKVN